MRNSIKLWVGACVSKGVASVTLVVAAFGMTATAHAQVAPTAPGVRAEVIYTTTFEGKYEMQYLRLIKGTGDDQKTAYAIWFPPPVRAGDEASQGGAVLLTNPYAGIDWTSEPPDVWAYGQAATLEFTLIPDVYGPGYKDESPVFVAYDYSEYYDSGAFALPFLMNGFGAMIVFERFYAGASLQDNINSSLMGLEYIKAQPGISMSKVAVWGSSWGGSLSTYAAAQAPADLKPAIGVACTPILDFEKFVSYGTLLPSVSADPTMAYYRMEPYVRRVRAAAEKDGMADYSRYTLPAVQAGLTMPFLFLHDSFDSIAPFVHQAPLYFDGNPQRELLLYPHLDSAADWTTFDVGHTPVTPGYDEPTALLFSYTYLMTRLSTATDWILMPVMPNLNEAEFFTYMFQQRQLGYDANRYLKPRLLDLCDPRIFIVSYTDQFTNPVWGRSYVVQMLNKYWGLDLTEANVVEYLNTTGL